MTTPQDQQPLPWEPYAAALALAYGTAMDRIRRSVNDFIRRQFRHGDLWNDARARAFTEAVPPVVAGAQRAVSAATSAYLDRLTSEMTGTAHFPVPVPASEVTGSAVRAGVDPKVVYRRPYVQVWTDLAAGTPLEQAVENGERRALTIANTDLQLAKTHTAHRVVQQDERAVGWRRVPRGPYTCALCLILSTRRYRKEELAPVHANCDCGIESVTGHFDPGPVLDERFLNAVHDAIRRDLGKDYVARSGKAKNTKARELDYLDIVVIHDHGEIGPVIGVRGQKFKKLNVPDDIPRLTHKKIPR